MKKSRKEGSSEGLKQGANRLHESQEKMIKKHRSPQTIGSFGRDTNAYVKNPVNPGNFTREQLLTGRFIPYDEKDTDMKLLRQIQDDQNRTQFGTVAVDPKMLIDYYKGKKNQTDYTKFLTLGSLMIDEKDPSSQKRAYQVIPELEKIPEAFFQEQFAFQASIYQMLRDGQIRGKEDLETLSFLARQDVMLPLTPLWDLNGFIVDSIKGTKEWKAYQLKMTQKGYFNPFNWNPKGPANSVPDEMKAVQKLAKIVLFRRLLPGLRNADEKEADRIITALGNETNQLGDNWQTTPDDIKKELNDLTK